MTLPFALDHSYEYTEQSWNTSNEIMSLEINQASQERDTSTLDPN